MIFIKEKGKGLIPEVTWAKFTCIGPLSSTAGRKYKAFLSMAAGKSGI